MTYKWDYNDHTFSRRGRGEGFNEPSLIDIFMISIDQMALYNVKGVARIVEPTEN